MPRLCIVTALPAESRPVLDACKLRQEKACHLRLYTSEDYLLLETGPGKLNAAASVAAVLQTHPDIASVVNIGIAGGFRDYGDVVAAHHVQDRASGAQWYPHLPDSKAFRAVATASINTVDTPDTQYQEGVLFDMEAAGIFTAASRHLSTSQIHSIKVVSDNPTNALEDISKNTVIELIGQALPTLLPMLATLRSKSETMTDENRDAANAFIADAINKTHHSVNDEQLLLQLVQRHMALTGHLPVLDSQAATAKSIRHSLLNTMDTLPFVYHHGRH